MRHQERLDLARRDHEVADPERLPESPLEDRPPRLLLDAEVARAEPAIGREGGGGLLGFLVVAARHELAAELQLARLARPARGARLRVHKAHLEPRRRIDARELP